MSVWFRRVSGLNTETMREIADAAGVSWSTESIVYRGKGIGYTNGANNDVEALQDAAESLIGYRPVVIEEPQKPSSGGDS